MTISNNTSNYTDIPLFNDGDSMGDIRSTVLSKLITQHNQSTDHLTQLHNEAKTLSDTVVQSKDKLDTLTISHMTDVPFYDNREANKVLAVNSFGTGIEFIDSVAGEEMAKVWTKLNDLTLNQLKDVPEYSSQQGKILAVNQAGDGLEFVDKPTSGTGGSATFTGLTDVPQSYQTHKGKALVVNEAESALTFVETVAKQSFDDVSSKVDAIEPKVGQLITDLDVAEKQIADNLKSVESAAQALATKVTDVETKVKAVDLRVDANENKIVSLEGFKTGQTKLDARSVGVATISSTDSLTAVDIASSHCPVINATVAGKTITMATIIGHNATALSSTEVREGRVTAITNTGDQEVVATADTGQKFDINGMESNTVTIKPKTTMTFLPSVSGVAKKWVMLSVNKCDTSKDKLIDLAEMPSGNLVAQKYLKVNANGTAIEYVDGPAPSVGAANFLELSDTPGNYTGAANKILQVNANGDGIEFKDHVAANVNFNDIQDATDLEQAHAKKYLVVNDAGDGLTFSSETSDETKAALMLAQGIITGETGISPRSLGANVLVHSTGAINVADVVKSQMLIFEGGTPNLTVPDVVEYSKAGLGETEVREGAELVILNTSSQTISTTGTQKTWVLNPVNGTVLSVPRDQFVVPPKYIVRIRAIKYGNDFGLLGYEKQPLGEFASKGSVDALKTDVDAMQFVHKLKDGNYKLHPNSLTSDAFQATDNITRQNLADHIVVVINRNTDGGKADLPDVSTMQTIDQVLQPGYVRSGREVIIVNQGSASISLPQPSGYAMIDPSGNVVHSGQAYTIPPKHMMRAVCGRFKYGGSATPYLAWQITSVTPVDTNVLIRDLVAEVNTSVDAKVKVVSDEIEAVSTSLSTSIDDKIKVVSDGLKSGNTLVNYKSIGSQAIDRGGDASQHDIASSSHVVMHGNANYAAYLPEVVDMTATTLTNTQVRCGSRVMVANIHLSQKKTMRTHGSQKIWCGWSDGRDHYEVPLTKTVELIACKFNNNLGWQIIGQTDNGAVSRDNYVSGVSLEGADFKLNPKSMFARYNNYSTSSITAEQAAKTGVLTLAASNGAVSVTMPGICGSGWVPSVSQVREGMIYHVQNVKDATVTLNAGSGQAFSVNDVSRTSFVVPPRMTAIFHTGLHGSQHKWSLLSMTSNDTTKTPDKINERLTAVETTNTIDHLQISQIISGAQGINSRGIGGPTNIITAQSITEAQTAASSNIVLRRNSGGVGRITLGDIVPFANTGINSTQQREGTVIRLINIGLEAYTVHYSSGLGNISFLDGSSAPSSVDLPARTTLELIAGYDQQPSQLWKRYIVIGKYPNQ